MIVFWLPFTRVSVLEVSASAIIVLITMKGQLNLKYPGSCPKHVYSGTALLCSADSLII